MNPQGVLRQPRGPPVDAGTPSFRQNGTTETRRPSFERNESVSSEYSGGELSPRQGSPTFMLDEELDEEYQCYLTSIDSPAVIWVQKADLSVSEELEQLSSKLQIFCGNRPLLQTLPIKKKVYGGIYAEDGKWYRCLILEIKDMEKIKVRFIDYGNTETLKSNQIVKLSKELYNYDAFAKQFVLRGVSNPTDENSPEFIKGIELLSSLISDKVLTIKNKQALIHDNASACLSDVVFQENGQEVIVNHQMIKNGFASVTPPPISPTLPTLTAKTPEAMQKSPLYIKTETPRMVDDHSITRTPVKHQNGEITAKHPLNVNEGADKKRIHELEEQNKKQAISIETLKQLCLQLEKSREIERQDSKNKLNEHLNSAVSRKIGHLLGCVAQVRKTRKESATNADGALKAVLGARTLLKGSEDKLQPEKIEELIKVKLLVTMHEDLQKRIRECSDKSELPELVKNRDQTRQDLYGGISLFIDHVNKMGLDVLKANLEVAQSSLKLFTNASVDKVEDISYKEVVEHVKKYEEYMVKKEESLDEMCEMVNKRCKSLQTIFTNIIKSLDLEQEQGGDGSLSDIDKTMELTEAYIQEETAKTKTSKEEVELREKAVISSFSEIKKQLNAINTLRDGLLKEYGLLQDKLEKCKDTKPDLEPALAVKKNIRALKSKLRHKLVDRDDMKEMEDCSEADASKLDEELDSLYNKLHKAFVEEDKIISHLSHLTEEQFPELILQYPDSGVKQFLDSNGMIKNSREIEHYALEETSEPTVFLSKFCEEKCYIKEYILMGTEKRKEFQSRAVDYHRISNSSDLRLLNIDGLFYSKNGRSAYLQVPYYVSLEEWLPLKPPSYAIISVLRDVLQVMEGLHNSDLVHGEVVISNVFVTTEDNVSASGILGHYDFSQNQEERISRTARKLGFSDDVPKSTKFDVICVGKILETINDMGLFDKDNSDIQSLINANLDATQQSSIPSIRNILQSSFFKKVEQPVDQTLD